MLSTIVDLAVEIEVERLVSAVSVLSTIVDLAVEIEVERLVSAVSVLATIVDSEVDKAVDRAVIDAEIVLKLMLPNTGAVVSEDLSIPVGIAA